MALVFLLVSTGAVTSFTPSSITILLINSVLKSSWIAVPGLGCNLAEIVPLVPPTRTIFTFILSSSFIVYSEASNPIIPFPPLLIAYAASIPTAFEVISNFNVCFPSVKSSEANNICPVARELALVSIFIGVPSSIVIVALP